MEVVNGRTGPELEAGLADILGRENVRVVAIDMCDPFNRSGAGRQRPLASGGGGSDLGNRSSIRRIGAWVRD
jgi:hypothetical protein